MVGLNEGVGENPHENLANAIILRAVADYRRTRDEWLIREIERFFLSEWFGVLTNLNGADLIEALKKEKTTRRRRR